jgi:hypothetical protein
MPDNGWFRDSRGNDLTIYFSYIACNLYPPLSKFHLFGPRMPRAFSSAAVENYGPCTNLTLRVREMFFGVGITWPHEWHRKWRIAYNKRQTSMIHRLLRISCYSQAVLVATSFSTYTTFPSSQSAYTQAHTQVF